MVCGMLFVRVPRQIPAPFLCACILLRCFGHEGEPPTRKSSAGARHRGAALRLFSFCQLIRCSEKDSFRSCNPVHVQRLEWRHVRLESSLPFPSPAPSIVTWVFISSCSRRDPRRWKKRRCVLRGFFHLSNALCVQLRFQGSPSSCCGLSCPSLQLPIQGREPVPCVQVLFRAVFQVPEMSPRTFPSVLCALLVQKPACDAVPKVAFVHRFSWTCDVG